MMEQFVLFVEKKDEDKRIDVWIAEELETYSRNSVQKLIDSGKVWVNHKPCKANYKVRANDCIVVEPFEPIPLTIEPEDIPIAVLYEDKDLIVVNKPCGMVVHPAAGHLSGTLVNALLFHCKGSLSGINGVMRPGIVHRIDKDTSGALVVAKNNVAHVHLALQLAEHSMLRQYIALVFNNIKDDSGTINKPIGRHPVDRKKMSVAAKTSKESITHYRVLERFHRSGAQNMTLIEARLETGRTHQIRVHMASTGHPVVGDTVYGSGKQGVALVGQALHAQTLGFVHPTSGEYMRFDSELPDSFHRLLTKLRS